MKEMNLYVSPEVEVISVMVEKGFAESVGSEAGGIGTTLPGIE